MLVSTVSAQENPAPPMTAPPPPKIISPEERAKIDEEKDDAKDRLRTTLELAEIRLNKAQSLTDQHDFHAASTELGRYAALIEDAFAFLSPMSRDRNKTRDLYKRLELALRAHGPRITSIRRVTPLEYAVWIKQLEDFARKGRTAALNSFYGHTVVRDAPAMPSAEKKPKQPQDNSLAPGSKP
ncbi:MAG TPA: hypothetical protein VFH31_09740 [Pyrinomonadaceae bacterium]|nr:hypothetical protein [Pyrinomonadaceae bacterium]